MSRYTGKIEKLKNFVATDPHYKDDVWCRYAHKFSYVDDWNVDLIIKNEDYFEDYEGMDLHIRGISFKMLLTIKDLNLLGKAVELLDNENVRYSKRLKLKENEVGMDTAQVCFGANEKADEINNFSKELLKREKANDYDYVMSNYRPDFSLKTLTDGMFGNVNEFILGSQKDPYALSISGWLTADAGYSEDDILNYLQDQLQIKDLTKIKDYDEDKPKDISD